MQRDRPTLTGLFRYMMKNHRSVRAETSSPRATRFPSSDNTLGVSTQALNPLQALETLGSGYEDHELSSWEGSSGRTMEELCIECVENHGLCRKHAIEPPASARGIGKSLSRSRSASVGATVIGNSYPGGLESLQENRPSSCGMVEPRRRRVNESIGTS